MKIKRAFQKDITARWRRHFMEEYLILFKHRNALKMLPKLTENSACSTRKGPGVLRLGETFQM